MSKHIYRNGKLETVSDAEWRQAVQAHQDQQASEVAKVENKGNTVVVTTKDGRTHRVGSISGEIANLIVGGSGPIHTGNGDQIVNGKKTPKKPKRNPWF